MKIAIVQMCSSANPFENLNLVHSYILEAQEHGASLICFPENVFYRGPKKAQGWEREEIMLRIHNGKILPDREFAIELLECMSEWKISVSLGSVLEAGEEKNQTFNTHLFFTPKKDLIRYQKIHLFRFHGQSVVYEEGKDFHPGSSVEWAELGTEKIGLGICFDLRFPELFRKLVFDHGCSALLVPSAFAVETGMAHWHSLLRARAIENQCAVFAAAQVGSHIDSKGQLCHCFGHSLAIDPWGEILWEGPKEGDAMGIIHWGLEKQRDLRRRLPVLEDARLWFQESANKTRGNNEKV